MMEIVFRQFKRYGCGFYTLANFLNEEKFLEYIKEDKATFYEHMNQALREICPGFFLTCYFCTHSGLKVQNRFFDTSLLEIDRESLSEETIENNFRPLFVSIRLMNGVHHLILVIHRLKDNNLYIFNSLKEWVEVCTQAEFVIKYWVTEIYLMESEEITERATWGAPNYFLNFDYRAFLHLKPEV